MPKPFEQLTIRLPVAVAKKVRREAGRRGLSVSATVVEILAEHAVEADGKEAQVS